MKNMYINKYVIILMTFLMLLYCFYYANKLNKNKEDFNISLEKQYSLYSDYRNFIDGNDYLLLKHNPAKRNFPYKISTNCFADKFQRCKYVGKYKTGATIFGYHVADPRRYGQMLLWA